MTEEVELIVPSLCITLPIYLMTYIDSLVLTIIGALFLSMQCINM